MPTHKAALQPSPADDAPTPSSSLHGEAVVHASRVVYQGKVFSVTADEVTEPGGVTGTRDVIRHNGSVVVLAVDTSQSVDDPTILLERQYRHAAGCFLLELPAGRIEPGEAPLAAAERELIEETGYRAQQWSPLVQYYASPGFLSEYFNIFLAEHLTIGEATPEEDEKIELLPMRLSELTDRILSGDIRDGKTITATLLFRERRLRGQQH